MGALDQGTSTLLTRIVLCLLPMIPFMLAILALVKHIRSMDELKNTIAKESIIIAVAIAATISTVLGLLELNSLIPPLPLLIFPLALVSIWGVVQIAVSRRYS